MISFEYVIWYLCLFVGTMLATLTRFGFNFLGQQDFIRGIFFLALSAACVIAWIAPLTAKYKSVGINALRLIVLLVLVIQVNGFLQKHFFESLPLLMP